MRPTLPEIYMGVAKLFSLRSTCPRGSVGTVIVKNGRIICTGYVGSPPGEPHCDEVGCLIEESYGYIGCVRTVHAEQNTLMFAARNGINIDGGTMYTTLMPCLACSKLLVLAGIRSVVYLQEYRDNRGVDYLQSHSVKVSKYE